MSESKPDVSILIVHTFEGKTLRQTLRGIRRAAPKISYEILVIDNNPAADFDKILREEFPQVRYVANEKNLGFGGAMNRGIRAARGRYHLIFNPDIIISPGSLEELMRFMDANPDIGLCGPRLENPDGSVQYSTYRLPTLLLPVYRRTPLGRLSFAKRIVEDYLMMKDSHEHIMDVDAMIGAALFCRKEALENVGLFDERFFLYYEDNDLCRRFWEKGYRVVYFPSSRMMHYHRRATADGGLLGQLLNKMTWIQIASFIKYVMKYKGKSNPRVDYLQKHARNLSEKKEIIKI